MIRATLALAAAAMFFTVASDAQSPCKLLNPQQIMPIINGPVTPGQPGGSKDSPDCTWRDAKGETRIYLSLKSRDNFNVTKAQMQHAGRMANVSGVGEDAFFVTSAAGSTAYLYTIGKHHQLLLEVNIANASKQDNEAAEKALANQILPKI